MVASLFMSRSEDIAHDVAAGRYYVLIEASPRGAGFMAKVQEYDDRFAYRGKTMTWNEWQQAGFDQDSVNS